MPYDYDPDCPYATLLPMHDFGWHQFNEAIPSHFLAILDCCYSGSVASRGKSKKALADYLRLPARDVLTAGQSDQKVKEENGNGIFTRALIDGLNGKAFPPGESWISVEELHHFIKKQLEEANQTPQHFRLHENGSQGMVVFEHPKSCLKNNNN